MRISFLTLVATASLAISTMAAKTNDTDKRLDQAADVLSDMMNASDKGIPQDLIGKAQCVVVVPNLKKAGFIVGGKYGKGFVMCRHEGGDAGWTAPAAIRIEGGSFGFQIGASETDVIMLVMNKSGEKRLLESKFTLGGDASVAAGPLGRDASANTDATMKAEILSYSRSRGVFAGLSLDGATLRQDQEDNMAMYGKSLDNKEILEGSGVTPPAAAAKLETLLGKNSMRKGA